MTTVRTHHPRPDHHAGPGLLDALSLLSEVADELVVRTARETHEALLDRVHAVGRTAASRGRSTAGSGWACVPPRAGSTRSPRPGPDHGWRRGRAAASSTPRSTG